MVFKKGYTPWNKGISLDEKTRQKLRGHIPWNKGKGMSIEEKKNNNQRLQKEYRLRNPDKILTRRRKWRQNNPDYGRIHYNCNREEYLQRTKLYKRQNPEKYLKSNKKYYDKLGFPLKLTVKEIRFALQSWTKLIRKRDSDQCQICPSKAEISHHIIHKSKYPALSLNINNGIALCKKCHNEVHGWKLNY